MNKNVIKMAQDLKDNQILFNTHELGIKYETTSTETIYNNSLL